MKAILTYPKGNHRWEIERGNASTHSKGHTERKGIHVTSNTRHSLPKLQTGDTAAVFHNLCM